MLTWHNPTYETPQIILIEKRKQYFSIDTFEHQVTESRIGREALFVLFRASTWATLCDVQLNTPETATIDWSYFPDFYCFGLPYGTKPVNLSLHRAKRSDPIRLQTNRFLFSYVVPFLSLPYTGESFLIILKFYWRKGKSTNGGCSVWMFPTYSRSLPFFIFFNSLQRKWN